METILSYHNPITNKDSSLKVLNNITLPSNIPSNLFDEISKLPLVDHPVFTLFGKPAMMHRSIGFFSDVSSGYHYTRQMAPALRLNELLRNILDWVNEIGCGEYNSILVNKYNDHHDYISAHSDEMKDLVIGSNILSLSLGTSRIFRIRNKKTKEIVMDIEAGDMKLILMDGDFQNEYTHEIVKGGRRKMGKNKDESDEWGGCRISLTFRNHER